MLAEKTTTQTLKETPTTGGAAVSVASKNAKKELLMRFPAALALFFALNLGVGSFIAQHERVLDESVIQNSDSEARQQGRWAWWLTRAFLMRQKTPSIAVFGSSQIGAATFSADAFNLKQNLDCVTHRNLSTLEKAIEKRTGHHMDTVNLGMGGAMISDAFMLERALFHDQQSPALAIVTVSPRDFIDNDLPAPSATDPFKFLTPYVKLNGLEQAAYPELFSRFDWFLSQTVALKRMQQSMQSGLVSAISRTLPPTNSSEHVTVSGAETKDKKVFLQAISGSAGEVKPGEWVVPAVTPAGLWMDNTREYLHRYKDPNPPVYKCEQQFFKALLADLKEKHITVLVVEMPSLPMNRALLPASFWTQYKGWLAETCKSYDAELYDLSDNPHFLKEHYLDTVHLNSTGGNMVFEAIADALIVNERLAAVTRTKALKEHQQKGKDLDDMGASATIGTWH